MYDWILIGGGIHGTHLSHVLTTAAGVSRDRVVVLDPNPEPLAAWPAFTGNCGMSHLRSPLVHHLALPTDDLKRFALARTHIGYLGRYKRPSLALFDAHLKALVERHHLSALRRRTRVTGLTRQKAGWAVETEHGSIRGRRVLIAIGMGEQPRIPSWVPRNASDTVIHHLFAPGFRIESLEAVRGHIAVIGGGISAAQAALHLGRSHPGRVTLVSRRPLSVFEFDSDPCWLGPKCLTTFTGNRDWEARRTAIIGGRRPATIPAEVAHGLRDAIRDGIVRHRVGEIASIDQPVSSGIRLVLTNGDGVECERVVLGTGFEQARPGGPWLDTAIAREGLPLARCGYPMIAEDLSWGPGLYATGPLAELVLGPVSRNISGARLAGRRLLRVAREAS